MFDVVVCDPDDVEFEATNLGLLYTAVSRATTLGDDDGKNSAIYFTTRRDGDSNREFDGGRIRNIGKTKQGGQDYIRLFHRKEWVKHLSNNTRPSHLSEADRDNILSWGTTNRVSYDQLCERIVSYNLHKTRKRYSSPPTKKAKKRKQNE